MNRLLISRRILSKDPNSGSDSHSYTNVYKQAGFVCQKKQRSGSMIKSGGRAVLG